MKKVIYIFLILNYLAFSQIDGDDDSTPAVLEIRNTNPVEPHITEFDIFIKRNSNNWQRFANGTYYLEYRESFEDQVLPEINPDKVSIEYIGEADLNVQTTQDIEDLTDYVINTHVVNDAFVISIIGPDDYDNAVEVPINTSGEDDIRLGKFRITSKDGRSSVATKIQWKSPINYWQITAYKNDVDRDYNKVPENEYPDPIEFDRLRKFYLSDNINLENPESEINYSNDFRAPSGFVPRYVDAKYYGNGRIQVNWKTESERFLHNFVIKRMKKNFYTRVEEFASLEQYFRKDTYEEYNSIEPITNGPNSNPEYQNKWKIVATGTTYNRDDEFDIFFWDENTPENGNFNRDEMLSDSLKERMTSIGNEDPYPSLIAAEESSGEGIGNDYSWIDPEGLEKGEWGCYHVSYQDWNGNVIPLGYDCEQVPNSVIAFANAYPNPFETECQVDFELLDDVLNLKLRVVDPIGRVVTHAVGLDGTVLDNVSVPEEAKGDSKPSRYASRGTHTAKINIPRSDLSQGSYTLIITADPLNDNFVESSSAVVKLQVTR